MGCACGKESVEINNRKYVVRSRLGEGGFSYVDLVECLRTHKLYALKRITTHSREDEIAALKEIEYYRAVKHPNVIQCIDWSVKPPDIEFDRTGEVLILLPFLRRGTLQDEIESRQKNSENFTEEQVLQIFHKICLGIKAFHHSKPTSIAHRDIKPGNILLSDDFSPVIMDLGSAGPARQDIRDTQQAKAFEDMAAQHCSMLFRAPEFFHVESRSSIDERTDIWSLGCTLYAICFLKSPFEVAYERGNSVALAVIGGNIQTPSSSPYSQKLHELILSMLLVNAMERPFIEEVIKRVEYMLKSNYNSGDC
ncbi:hypothetical protein CHUAL_012992 [Chamberlinius hualienensis]